MYEQNSVFKYLKHQARCIEAQLGEEDKHCFFIGTYTPQPENELHLVEFIEETNEIITRNIFTHPNEIYSISSCPTNPSLLFTTHRGGFMDNILKQTPKQSSPSPSKPVNEQQNPEKPVDDEKKDDKEKINNAEEPTNKDKDNPDEIKEEQKPPNAKQKDNPNLYKATLWRLIGQDSSDTLDNDLDLDDDFGNV